VIAQWLANTPALPALSHLSMGSSVNDPSIRTKGARTLAAAERERLALLWIRCLGVSAKARTALKERYVVYDAQGLSTWDWDHHPFVARGHLTA
jgi:hypothetical protein